MVWLRFYHHFDAAGSTAATTTATESIVGEYSYDAFGVRRRVAGVAIPFEFIGESGYRSDGTSLGDYVRQRTYQPSIARFLSVDPRGHSEGPNKYQYSANNPVAYIDPSGEMKVLKLKYFVSLLCGGYQVHPYWLLTPRDPLTGKLIGRSREKVVIIQKVCQTHTVIYCVPDPNRPGQCTKSSKRVNHTECFYEAMLLEGNLGHYIREEKAVEDRLVEFPISRPGGCPNTSGTIRESHTQRLYYLTDEIKAEIDKWPVEYSPGFGPAITTSGASKSAPSFWDTAAILDRSTFYLRLSWNCCCDPPKQALDVSGDQKNRTPSTPPKDFDIHDELPFEFEFRR
jgi:RHS repeat-associated protein